MILGIGMALLTGEIMLILFNDNGSNGDSTFFGSSTGSKYTALPSISSFK